MSISNRTLTEQERRDYKANLYKAQINGGSPLNQDAGSPPFGDCSESPVKCWPIAVSSSGTCDGRASGLPLVIGPRGLLGAVSPGSALEGPISLPDVIWGEASGDPEVRVTALQSGSNAIATISLTGAGHAVFAAVEIAVTQPGLTSVAHDAAVFLEGASAQSIGPFAVYTGSPLTPALHRVEAQVRIPADTGDLRFYVMFARRQGQVVRPDKVAVVGDGTDWPVATCGLTGLSAGSVSVTASLCIPGSRAFDRLMSVINRSNRSA